MIERVIEERPILFSGPMVQAILAGRKTQTRRIVKAPKCATVHDRSPQWDSAYSDPGGTIFGPGPYLKLPYSGSDMGDDKPVTRIFCPYGYPENGARLWVRETWRADRPYDDLSPREIPEDTAVWYPADRKYMTTNVIGKVRPSIFMPRWASRITLEVCSVRVERLQDISDEDAMAEGIESLGCEIHDGLTWWDGRPIPPGFARSDNGHHPKDTFADLWDCINAKRAPWISNPWVWVIEFRRMTPHDH